MPAPYLVLFVADPADDDHAAALREAARAVAGAGFFDDPDGGPERTVGAYVLAERLAAGAPLVDAVAGVSERLAVRVEVQWREEILGWIEAGTPDAALRAALARDGGSSTAARASD